MNTKMNYPILNRKNILLVEDDPSMIGRLNSNLCEIGCIVSIAKSVAEAEELLDSIEKIDIAIVDMYIPEKGDQFPDRIMRGEELSYTIHKRSPITKIVGISNELAIQPIMTHIGDLFSRFIYKKHILDESPPIILFETLESILINPQHRKPKVFIVHGHDNEILLQLKNYLQNTLKWGEPIILREKAALGKTIIEKFETEVRNVDIVFVLLTPDDNCNNSNSSIRRARQNVIFEMGFFYAKLQRTSGKVILLVKDDLDIPSDISGITYIDISNGIYAAGEDIRREINELGWTL